MSFDDQFSVIDDAVAPQPWMQLRMVATAEGPSASKSYDVSDGWAKNQLVQSVQTAWTNNSPVNQWVYGLATKAGTQVTLQCRSRGYLSTKHGAVIDGDPAAIAMVEVSRFGVGTDLGAGGLLAIGGAYGISELRQNSMTMPLMPHVTGWFLVAPGETFNARVEVWFVSTFWENTQIDGGDNDTESKFIAGEFRLDLFAVPALEPIKPRGVPSIVGFNYDVEIDLGFADTRTSVNVPDGVLEGDTLLAIVANQVGSGGDIQPVEGGWTLLHSRTGAGLAGILNTHIKIFLRTATADEPDHYRFENGLLAEETAVIVALRGAEPYLPDYPNWYTASNLAKSQLVAPSIAVGGQLLLTVSYFGHALLQGAIDQIAPAGMDELVDIANTMSSLQVSFLDNPPNPTRERATTPAEAPQFTGQTINASILIPGSRAWDDTGVTSNQFHWNKAKHTLFCVRGTFARGTQALYLGNPLGNYETMVGDGVDQSVWKVVDVHYPGDQLNLNAFFKMDQTSSVGAQTLISMINQIPPGSKFAFAATSQGAGVCSMVYQEIQSGSLTSRAGDLIAATTFGNPMREAGHTIPGGSDPGGGTPHHGVLSTDLLTDTDGLWWDFCNTGDLVADVADDTLGHGRELVFQLLYENWGGSGSFVSEVTAAFGAGFFSGVALTLSDLLGIAATLIETMVLSLSLAVVANPVLNTSAHCRYHFPYTNLPGNTKSAVRLAIEYLDDVGHSTPLP